MNEVRNLLVGLEIGRGASRLSYFDRGIGEPVPLAVKTGTNLYEYPTVLVKVRGRDEWHIGYEAEYFAGQSGAERVPRVLPEDGEEEETVIDGKSLSPADVLSVFISESLRMLGVPDYLRSIKGICVTTEHLTPRLAVSLRQALLRTGFDREACFVQDFDESFYYFGFSQKPELCIRNMGLLQFEETGAVFSGMTEIRGTKPFTVTVGRKGSVSLPKAPEDRDAALADAADEWVPAGSYSGIFLTGHGFSTEWADASVKALSKGGARVFEDENLFAKGACWAVFEKLERHSLRNRVYLGPNLVTTSVGTDVSDAGRPARYPLIRAGINWYENEATCEVILDDRAEILLTSVFRDGKAGKNHRLMLEGLPARPRLASRIRLSAFCPDAERCVVRAEDLGFGELYPSGGLTWELEIPLRPDDGDGF